MAAIARRLTIFTIGMAIFAIIFSILAAQPVSHGQHAKAIIASTCEVSRSCTAIL